MHVNYHYFTQLYTTLLSCPLWIYHFELLLVIHLLHLGNAISKDQNARWLFYGCGFQQFIALFCKAYDFSIEFSPKGGFFFLLLLWEFCSYLCRFGFQAHAWRDEVVYDRPISRPGNRSLVFHSQLCPLLVAWLQSTYILFKTTTPCHV